MAPSRSKKLATSRPELVTDRLVDSLQQPTITVNSGTPTRKYHPHEQISQSISSHQAVKTKSYSPPDLSSSSAEDSFPSAGPRPNIDDDNGEGDPDLISPVGDASILQISGSEDSEDGVEDDDGDENLSVSFGASTGALPNNSLQRSNSTPVLISAPPNAFAPPFYNRPPTPLPPSPSLTSLLRPSFSSRPTTPDDSESEVAPSNAAIQGSVTEAAVAKSARDARTIPRASPKVPTYEYYGFVLYLTSGLCFLTYLLWSYLPSPFLHQLGIYYYPDRWWSLAVPAFLVMLLVYIYIALAAYNTEYLTPHLGSITNFVDEAANVATIKPFSKNSSSSSSSKDTRRLKGSAKNGTTRNHAIEHQKYAASHHDIAPDWKSIWNESTDAVMDVPIGGVCEILYGER